MEKTVQMGIERAGNTGVKAADGERQVFELRDVDSHGLRGDLVLADRDNGSSMAGAQQVAHHDEQQCQHTKHPGPGGPGGNGHHAAGTLHGLDHQVGILQCCIDHDRKAQCGDAEIVRAQPQQRQAHEI